MLDYPENETTFARVTQLVHYLVYFLWVNETGTVLVEQIEGISQLFVVLGVKSVFPGEFRTRGGGLGAGGGATGLFCCSAHILIFVGNK